MTAGHSVCSAHTHTHTYKHNHLPIHPLYLNTDLTWLHIPCVAVCCSVLQCVAVCCSVLQYVAVCCSAFCFDFIWFHLHPASHTRMTAGHSVWSAHTHTHTHTQKRFPIHLFYLIWLYLGLLTSRLSHSDDCGALRLICTHTHTHTHTHKHFPIHPLYLIWLYFTWVYLHPASRTRMTAGHSVWSARATLMYLMHFFSGPVWLCP